MRAGQGGGLRVLAMLVCCILLGSGPSRADVARPADLNATLVLLYEAMHAADPSLNLRIDRDEQVIELRRSRLPINHLYPDNLDRKLRAAADGAERQVILDGHVAVMLESLADDAATGKGPVQPFELTQVFPVLRSADFIPQESFAETPAEQLPGDLQLSWVIDQRSIIQTLNTDAMEWAGLNRETLRERALANLRAKAVDMEHERDDPLHWLWLDGLYESSLLLLPELWQQRAAV